MRETTVRFFKRFSKGDSQMRIVIGFCCAICVVVFAGWMLLGQERAGELVVEAVQGQKEEAPPKPPTVKQLIIASEQDFVNAKVELRQRWVTIYKAEAEAAKIDGDLRAEKEKLTHEELILLRTQEKLEGKGPDDMIPVGGTLYTYHQVNGDALQRVASCNVLRRAITLKEQSLAELQKVCQDGREIIRKAVDELRTARIEFESEKVELAALRAQKHVKSIIGTVYASGDVKTDLGQARQAFNEYLANERGSAQFDQEIGTFQTGVVATWNQELGIESDSAFDAVSNYFQAKDPAEEVSTPKEPQSDLTRALEDSVQNEQ